MKRLFVTLLVLVAGLNISGCYTMFKHPAVEIVYPAGDDSTEVVEDYPVFVDEDCGYCHEEFSVTRHYNPLLPAHAYNENAWSETPWWFDNKYLYIFDETTGQAQEVYQPVPSSYPERRSNAASSAPAAFPMRAAPAAAASASSGDDAASSSQAAQRTVSASSNQSNERSVSGASSGSTKRHSRKRD
jgi:hypothetical protein